ncbi:protein kinase domain-containing protein [Rhizobium leguminosarum]|uniref:protein kinase domain-containing protein n=1 Tax=Rhizobium leguminosarum TaxID=384 RepID=UPI003F9846C4
MDSAKAHIIEKTLKGQKVGEWTIESLIDNGKSAAVFKASHGTKLAAVKVFDDELIERFGDKTQLARIERELSLKGKGHPNMVKILDGGFDRITNNHYLVMEYLPGNNLKKRLNDIPVEAIGGYISDLASCAEHLEKLDLVHRDIKPENILVSEDFKKITLLDFGVLKPVMETGVTDVKGLHPFIGTLQYSSPEFLLRQEDGTIEGWRALTFYQIGGVLHDLIMREALFSEYAEPFARLVNAVQEVRPNIQSSSVPNYLMELAKTCLLKSPKDRLKFLTWDSFKPPKLTMSGVSSYKERVTKRVLVEEAESSSQSQIKPDFAKPLTDEIVTFTKESLRKIQLENESLPPLGPIVRFPPKNGASVKVTLDKSAPHLIKSVVCVVVSVEIVDAEARAVIADVCVHASGAPPVPFQNRTEFYSGIYDQNRYFTELEETIYKIIDQVQGGGIVSDTWLQIESKMESGR